VTVTADPDGGGAARARLARAARIGGGLLALAALGWAAALAAVSTPAVEARLRDRLSRALEERFPGATVGEVSVDWRFRLRAGPVHVPPHAGRPGLEVGWLRVAASTRALLSGRVAPGAIALRGVRLAGPLALGPLDVDLSLSRPEGGERAEGTARLARGGRAAWVASRDAGGWRVRLRAALGPEDLPARLRGEAARVERGEALLEISAEAPSDLSRAEARVGLLVHDAFLAGERIAPEPVGPLRAAASGLVSWDRRDRRVALRDGVVSLLGAVPLALAGELRAEGDLPFSLSVRAEAVDYRALVAALPPGLALPPAAPRPPGSLAARLDLAGPLATPAAWTVAARLDLARLREAARRAPSPLRAPFVHRPDPADPARTLVVGPASPDFVPIGELPEHVLRAVTTSEDAGFFGHDGFDFDELRNALAEGAEAGKVVRGGSTITQQLAKNLFLSPERTLARKAREAIVAVGLEAELPKRRLLEIYLNVAEWGPGLWGIGPAARHWFGKDARELSPKEAAFLASIIPSPIRYHAMYARGFASEAWEAHVNDLLFRMTEQGALTEDELVEGLAAPIFFAGG
jgi:transglycosylase-like protein